MVDHSFFEYQKHFCHLHVKVYSTFHVMDEHIFLILASRETGKRKTSQVVESYLPVTRPHKMMVWLLKR